MATLSLNYQNFPVVLEDIAGMNVHSYTNGKNGWFHKEDDTFGQVVEYEYKDDSGELTQYRTWFMETSQPPQRLGLLVSAKIDHIRGASKDDHIILICGFDMEGNLSMAQATVQITSDDSQNLVGKPVTITDAGGDVGKIDDMVYDQIHKHNFHDTGRNTIAWAVKANIISLRDSIKKS